MRWTARVGDFVEDHLPAVLISITVLLIAGLVVYYEAMEDRRQAWARQVAAACADTTDDEYLGCRRRFLDRHGLRDPGSESSGPIIIHHTQVR